QGQLLEERIRRSERNVELDPWRRRTPHLARGLVDQALAEMHRKHLGASASLPLALVVGGDQVELPGAQRSRLGRAAAPDASTDLGRTRDAVAEAGIADRIECPRPRLDGDVLRVNVPPAPPRAAGQRDILRPGADVTRLH